MNEPNSNQFDYSQYSTGTQQQSYSYFYNTSEPADRYNPELDKKANELKKLGLLCGAGIIGFFAVQRLAAIMLRALGLVDLYVRDLNFQTLFGMVLFILYIFIPFLVVLKFYTPEQKNKVISFYDKPKSVQLYVLAAFSGLMICTVGDFAGSFFTNIFNAMGMEYSSPDQNIPTGPFGNILFIIQSAFMPALFEEFAFRGVVMQPLRKYGEKFAIVSSAILFAFLHGSMTHIPFAFIAGLALGYFSIATGSIWTSVSIHFLNNFLSVINSIYYMKYPETGSFMFIAMSIGILAIGIFAIILFKKSNEYKLKKGITELKKSSRTFLYFCTPTLAFGFVLAVNTSMSYLEITSGLGAFIVLAFLVSLFIFTLAGRAKLSNDKTIYSSGIYTLSAVLTAISVVAIMLSMLANTLLVN